jgi:N utilization substance protein A
MRAGPSLPFAESLHTASMRADPPLDPAHGAGVEDALREIPGIMAAMLVAFGANGIRTVEDLAACATDDLVGWTEQSGTQITRHPGILGDLLLSRQECDAIILRARIRAGWIEAAALTS